MTVVTGLPVRPDAVDRLVSKIDPDAGADIGLSHRPIRPCPWQWDTPAGPGSDSSCVRRVPQNSSLRAGSLPRPPHAGAARPRCPATCGERLVLSASEFLSFEDFRLLGEEPLPPHYMVVVSRFAPRLIPVGHCIAFQFQTGFHINHILLSSREMSVISALLRQMGTHFWYRFGPILCQRGASPPCPMDPMHP
jgi:hypothetical protein